MSGRKTGRESWTTRGENRVPGAFYSSPVGRAVPLKRSPKEETMSMHQATAELPTLVALAFAVILFFVI